MGLLMVPVARPLKSSYRLCSNSSRICYAFAGISPAYPAYSTTTLVFDIYYVFFVISGQVLCAESKSNVCQFVNVEHFFYGMKYKVTEKKLFFCRQKHQNHCICVLNININLGACSITEQQLYPGKRAWPVEHC